MKQRNDRQRTEHSALCRRRFYAPARRLKTPLLVVAPNQGKLHTDDTKMKATAARFVAILLLLLDWHLLRVAGLQESVLASQGEEEIPSTCRPPSSSSNTEDVASFGWAALPSIGGIEKVNSRAKRGSAMKGAGREKGILCGFSTLSTPPTGLRIDGLGDTFFRIDELPDAVFFDCSDADFGSKPDVVRGSLVAFDQSTPDHPWSWFACPSSAPDLTMNSECSSNSNSRRFSSRDVVLVVRGGGCSFARKVFEAQCLGAGAVVVADLSKLRAENGEFRMGSSAALDTFVDSIRIPSVLVAEPAASALINALTERYRDGSPPLQFIVASSESAISAQVFNDNLNDCTREDVSFWRCKCRLLADRCKLLIVSLRSNWVSVAGGLLCVIAVSALVLGTSSQRLHVVATILGLASIFVCGVLLRSGPTLRPGHPAADRFDDITSQLIYDGYDHAEADERVLRTLALGARAAYRSNVNPSLLGHHLLSNYHLNEPTWLSSPLPNEVPSYRLLGLAKENYDRKLFHHPPLFILGSLVWEEIVSAAIIVVFAKKTSRLRTYRRLLFLFFNTLLPPDITSSVILDPRRHSSA